MRSLIQDLRYAGRTLRHSPGFTLVAVATLALSLGANTAIFSFVDAVLLKPLPYPDADRIVRVLEAPPGGGRNGISTLNFLDWQKQSTCFEYLAAITGGNVSLTGVDEPVQLAGARVSAHYFDVFGFKVALGRTFVDGEDQAGRDHVVVLSDTLWRSQFGGDPGLVGRTIRLDGDPHTVIGVLPAGTPLERGYVRLWRPLTFTPANLTRNFHWFGAVARLKPGVTLEQARAQMDAIGARIARDFPDSNKGWGVGLDLLADTLVARELRLSLYVLLAAVGMVLLIACANLANLSLMRVVGREREIAIRTALGAGRWALARQFLTESVVVSLAGGALGLVVGRLAMAGLQASMPPGVLPSESAVTLDGRVMLFSFLLAGLTGVIIGLFPAWQAARPNLTDSLKQGGISSSAGGARSRVRSGLVVAEIALAFMLLSGAGLLIRSLDRFSRVDPGFDSTNVLTFRLPTPPTAYSDPAGLNAYLGQVTARLQTLPGVTDVALTSGPAHARLGLRHARPGCRPAPGRPRQPPVLFLQDGQRLVFPRTPDAPAPGPHARRHRRPRHAARDRHQRDDGEAVLQGRQSARQAHPRAGNRAGQNPARGGDSLGGGRRGGGRKSRRPGQSVREPRHVCDGGAESQLRAVRADPQRH
jgi:putative ABC transport system permease protein